MLYLFILSSLTLVGFVISVIVCSNQDNTCITNSIQHPICDYTKNTKKKIPSQNKVYKDFYVI